MHVSPRQAQPTEAPGARGLSVEQVREWRRAGQLANVLIEPVPDVREDGQPPAMPAATGRILTPPRPPHTPEPAAGMTMIAARQYTLILDDGRRFPIDRDGVIGRTPHADDGELAIQVSDPEKRLSRTHLRFERDAQKRMWAIDLHSGNGTELVHNNGDRTELQPGQKYPLADGDTLLLGETAVRVEASIPGE